MTVNAPIGRQHYEEAAAAIRAAIGHQPAPEIAIVLGSGLGALADAVFHPTVLPYEKIPYFPISTIPGHKGQLVIGSLQDRQVLIMQGRAHYYEGYSMQQITLPIRAFKMVGVHTVILTNAAGGINKSFEAGDLMLITDHINLVGAGGANPLRGPHDPELGPRFLDMSKAYDAQLRHLALHVAQAESLPLHQGVYVGLAGPTFETPAEIRYLRLIGGDAVGMSTVHETIVARHGNMRVLGVSGISNVAIDQIDAAGEASHEEVLETGALLAPRMTALVKGVLASL